MAGTFADPPVAVRPRVRWWWPGGAVTATELARELRVIREAGFARAEVSLLPMGLPATVGEAAVRTWGTTRFTDALESALRAARDEGLRLDLTVSPGWPLASPAVTGDRIDLAQQKLVQGYRRLAPGETVAAPPEPEGGPAPGDRLVAVTAARRIDDVLLDEASTIDLTGRVTGAELAWTAPADGSWLLFGFWSRPSGQRPVAESGAEDVLVVDHFSRAATQAAIDHLDRHVLPARLDPLLRAAGGDLFEDSLELATDGELWTADLPGEFRRRRGYDLMPFLPVLRIDGLYRFDWETLRKGINPETPADHEFPDGRGRRVRHDYYRTLNELYADHHVTPLTRWANSRGLRYRAQPYGNTMDHAEIAASVQVPESEDLVSWITAGGMTEGVSAYERVVDFHRGIASGAHVQGAPVVSLECCAVIGGDYQTSIADLKRHVDVAFSGGVNQVVLHGFPYDAVDGAAWPGWAPFSADGTPEVSEAWGERQPMWRHMRAYADQVARAAMVLQHGRPRVDVAFYRQAYWCMTWPVMRAANLADAGYTYGFLTPRTLAGIAFRGGRLDPEHAGYRALIIDDEPAMEPATARRLHELAAAGLPVIVVGAAPHRAPGRGDDDEVRSWTAALLALPGVRVVGTQEEILGALDEFGVRADARLRGAARVLPVHRQAADGDYYHLFNMGDTRARFTAELSGSGRVSILDLAAGVAHPVAAHPLRLELDPGETTVIHLGVENPLGARPGTTAPRTVPLREIWRRPIPELTLEVEDRHPGGVEIHRRPAAAPGDWRDLPGLADVSGIGTYRAAVDLPDGWDDGIDAVLLELGRVAGTARVAVNGAEVPGGRDVTAYLRTGGNVVVIEVATTLGNRLAALGRDGVPGFQRFAGRPARPAGLIGPAGLRAVAV